ncbi:MAG: hypothetical protein ACXABX_01570 [Candidatus Thorarchaeota archaeon]
MSNEEKQEEIDQVLDLLTKPLSRYILSVLAGVNPGSYKGPIDVQDDVFIDDEQ